MKLNISRDVLAEIGTVAVLHGLIEDELAELIIDLVGLSRPVGLVLTTELSFGQRVAIVSSLFLQVVGKEHPMYVRLHGLLKAIGDAEAQRNTAIHALWTVPADAADLHEVLRVKRSAKSKHGLVQDFRRLTLAQLKTITEQQARAFADLASFRHALHTTAVDGAPLDPNSAI